MPNKPLLQAYAGLFQDSFGPLKAQVQSHWQAFLRPDQRPHLGFVVTRRHEGIFVKYMQALLQALPAQDYRVSVVAETQAWSRLIAPALTATEVQHVPLPQAFEAAAIALAQQGFDLLYHWEVGTDAMNYFLPFLDLAPLQCTSLGRPQTSGIPNIDYFLSSALVEPEQAHNLYSEKLHLMPGLPLTCPEPVFPDQLMDLAALGLSPDQHHYVCVQNIRKLHPNFDVILAEILRHDPQGQISLFTHTSPFVTERVRARLDVVAPDVVSRIHWLPRLSWPQYLSLIQQVDVLLDTPYYAGANTSLEAFAAGTPVVTWPGFAARGRFTQACYQLMGVPGPIAESAEHYVKLAVVLGAEVSAQQALRKQILAHKHKLFQQDAVQGHLAFFQQLWEPSL